VQFVQTPLGPVGECKVLSKATSKTGTKTSILPPLTEATTRSSANSVLTKNITISQKAPVKVKLETNNVSMNIVDEGLSDEDETNGVERDAAVASPPKGKKCVTSAVSQIFKFSMSYFI
jgi:hypothetical protein